MLRKALLVATVALLSLVQCAFAQSSIIFRNLGGTYNYYIALPTGGMVAVYTDSDPADFVRAGPNGRYWAHCACNRVTMVYHANVAGVFVPVATGTGHFSFQDYVVTVANYDPYLGFGPTYYRHLVQIDAQFTGSITSIKARIAYRDGVDQGSSVDIH